MSIFTFNERMRLSIELAMASRSSWRAERLEAQARALGMSGAEVDVAREGRSFDAATSAAIALAIAAPNHRMKARAKAIRLGIPAATCNEIERFSAKNRVAHAPMNATG